jgi:hypothetical protein
MSGPKRRSPIQRRLNVRLRRSGSGLRNQVSEGLSRVTGLPRIHGMMEMVDAGLFRSGTESGI